MNHLPFSMVSTALIALTAAGSAAAAVSDAAPNGFTVTHEVTIAERRPAVYLAATARIGEWWSSDHTVSANAANLSLDARVHGCFCETLGDGAGLVHMAVTFVNPNVLLRLSGGLGPLGLMGVAGNMTWEFEDVPEGTLLTLNYAVGGYMPGGLDSVAGAVDGVLGEQMTRLKSYVETGSP